MYESLNVKFSDLKQVNPNLTEAKVYIAYPDRNKKKFDIKKELFTDAVSTLKGCAVIGYYSKEADEFLGHEGDPVRTNEGLMITPKPQPYGFVCDHTEPWWEEVDGKNYLVTKANLFTGLYPEAMQVTKKKLGQSMEVKFTDGEMVDGYFTPSKMSFLALCILGENVTATFEGAKFVSFSDTEEFKEEFSKLVEEAKEYFAKDTPAKPDERIKGSDKNPKDSASTKGSKITLDDATTKALENKVKEHNESINDETSKKATIGDLKKVYRRGAGAYSTSHRPGMTRNQWAMGRVNAYLYLLKNGKPKNAKYVTDNDLLPKDHPKKSKMSLNSILSQFAEDVFDFSQEDIGALQEEFSEEFAVPDKYKHINFKPTEQMAKNAQKALDIRKEKPDSQKGMTGVGLARARQLINRQELSPSVVRRMLSFFQRHEVDKQGSTWDEKGKGWQAWHGWSGDAGYAWAKKIVAQMDKADKKGFSNEKEGELMPEKEMMKMAMEKMMDYGMGRYLFAGMDNKYVYAMDMEKDMAMMKVPYAMEENMPKMAMEEMAYDEYEMKMDAVKMVMMMLKEMMMKMKGDHDMAMQKYSNTETELKASITTKDGEISTLKEEKEALFSENQELKIEKKMAEGKELLANEKFSMFDDNEKAELLEKLKDVDVDLAQFSLLAKAKWADKIELGDVMNKKDGKFSYMSIPHQDKDKKEKKDLFDGLYAEK